MLDTLKSLLSRFRTSKNYSQELNSILVQANPAASLYERLSWFVDLMQWIRYRSYLLNQNDADSARLPLVRIKFLLSILERNPEWKENVSRVLRTILMETRDVELFATSGLPEDQSFWGELFDRLSMKILPSRPLTEGGVPLILAAFPEDEDRDWLNQMSPELMQELIDLVLYKMPPEETFDSVIADIEDALMILASQVRAIGMTYQVRRRINSGIKGSPFFDLTLDLRNLLPLVHEKGRVDFREKSHQFLATLDKCAAVFQQVYAHLDEHGVSLKVVYLLELGHAKLKRIRDLVTLLQDERPDPERTRRFLADLVEETQQRQGVRSLLEQNTRLISQKIIERNANTGEHYIARSRREFREMFLRAAGGGVYMSVTVLVKVLMGLLRLPDFLQGFLYSINYSISFVAIQLSGFTLATKQPAMTGPALAAKIDQTRRSQVIHELVDEITQVFRSQMVGILGNVGVVIPCIVVLDLLYFVVFGFHMIQAQPLADKLMGSSHLLSFSGVFAAFTGVLLWLSSVIGGYVDNWFYLNRMQQTIAYNRRLNYIVGSGRAAGIARFLERNIAGLAANISLGLFLGILPEVMAFLGLFLDVRHVTLAAGNLALGSMYYGAEVLQRSDFWWSVLGIFWIGFLNVAVSFSLAFWVALRSRRMVAAKRHEIYRAILRRFRVRPLSFFFPPK